MTVVVEGLAVKAFEAVLTNVAKNTGQRAWSGVSPAQRRNRKRMAAMASLLRSLDFSDRVSLLGLLDDLPPGVSLARVERTLTGLEIKGVLHELICAYLAGASPNRIDAVRQNFVTVFTVQLGTLTDAGKQFSAEVCGRICSAITDLMGEISRSDPDSFTQLQQMASSGLINSTLEALGRHHRSLEEYADPDRLRELNAWVTDYRHQVEKEHGYIEPPDFERKRKVPMESLYVAPRIRGPHGTEPTPPAISIGDFIASIDRTVLLGDPGGGKSTAANNIAFTSAKDFEGRVPFFVVLRDFARDDDLDKSITEYISLRCATLYQCQPPPGAVEHLLLSGQAIVIFDGLDELIDTSKRRDVTRRVELFSERYPLCNALITSRRVGYEQAQLDPALFSMFQLSGFDENDVRDYVERWFSTVEELGGQELENAIQNFVEESRSVPDLTETPLMLALMCIIYRGQGFIPKNRPAVYEHCAVLLFEKWDSSRKIYVDLRAATQVDAAIKHLAYWMLTDQAGTEAVAESDLVAEAANYLRGAFEDEHERRRAAQEFVDFCRGRAWVLSDAGTTAEGEALFKFTHRTFMEYFAAYELTRRSDGPEQVAKTLLPHIAAQEWDVVGQLAVQISNKHSRDGAERIFRYFLTDRRRRSGVKRDTIHAFIWRCLSFVHVSPTLIRDLTIASATSSLAAASSRRARRFRDDGPSVENAVLVMPELRRSTADALAGVLVPMAGEPNQERSNFARLALLSWAMLPYVVEVKSDARHFWDDWSREVCKDHMDTLLSTGSSEQAAWRFALGQGYVEMTDFLAKSTSWPGYILDPLFSNSAFSPLGFGYGDWATSALHTPTRKARRSQGWSDPAYEVRIEQLRQLGEALDPVPRGPWVTGGDRGLGVTPAEMSWAEARGNEDVHWALWAIWACYVESIESFPGFAGPTMEAETASENDGPRLVLEALRSRHTSGEVGTDLFAGTVFSSFTGERAATRDAWAIGALGLVSTHKPR